jgi:phage terminase large subunit-like protein
MFSIQEEGESEKDFLNRVALKAERLSTMMRTEGWKEYEAYVRSEAASALASLGQAQTGDQAMKAGQTYTVLMKMIELPHKQHDEAVKLLRSK